MSKIALFTYRDWEKERQEKALTDHELVFLEEVLDPEHIPDEVKDAEIISVFVDSTVSSEVIDAFENLKCIVTRSTGYDHIDIAHAKEKGISVRNVPAYGANTVAEHAFALLLSLSKRIVDGYEQLQESGNYDPSLLNGFDLYGKTLGVIGTGNIGQHAIRIGNGFGMKVIGFDAFPKEGLDKELNFTYTKTLEELLEESDVITIHVPYLPQTHHLLSSENIPLMKEGAVLINTSRGPIVETEALFAALQSGQIRGAGLDVVEEEGFIKDEMNLLVTGTEDEHNLRVALMNHKLIDMPNVIMTPHSAFNTQEALERIVDTTIENIRACGSESEENLVVVKE